MHAMQASRRSLLNALGRFIRGGNFSYLTGAEVSSRRPWRLASQVRRRIKISFARHQFPPAVAASGAGSGAPS